MILIVSVTRVPGTAAAQRCPAAMARLTLESNYSENTFVFPPAQKGTDARVRIFGRTGEIPFAGHPTIGTAFALAHAGRIKPGTASTVFSTSPPAGRRALAAAPSQLWEGTLCLEPLRSAGMATGDVQAG